MQGTLHLILAVLVILNCIAFIVTKKHCFIYLAVAFTISLGTYLGYFRTQMKKKFNIRVSFLSLSVIVCGSLLTDNFWFYRESEVFFSLSNISFCLVLSIHIFNRVLFCIKVALSFNSNYKV